MSRFDPELDQLPRTVPIFPLSGVLLLPRGCLPLNIFEERYLNMVSDALAADRMIGMIQPCNPKDGSGRPEVYSTGCAGRIVQFEETDDGRFLITLKGIARFTCIEELSTTRGYRRVVADWSGFEGDLVEEEGDEIDRDLLLKPLKTYFEAQGMKANWDAIAETPTERLITSLSMICPFEPSEKQALLEAGSLSERTSVLTTLVEIAAWSSEDDEGKTQ